MLFIADLDGTLIQSEPLITDCYLLALRERGYTVARDILKSTIPGRHASLFLPELFPGLSPEDVKALRKRKNEIYGDRLKELKINSALSNLLKSQKASHQIAMATTASRAIVERIIRQFEWTGLFDMIVTGDDVARHKPDPECYLQILLKFQARPETTFAFEDSDAGVAAAEAAHLNVIKIAF